MSDFKLEVSENDAKNEDRYNYKNSLSLEIKLSATPTVEDFATISECVDTLQKTLDKYIYGGTVERWEDRLNGREVLTSANDLLSADVKADTKVTSKAQKGVDTE